MGTTCPFPFGDGGWIPVVLGDGEGVGEHWGQRTENGVVADANDADAARGEGSLTILVVFVLHFMHVPVDLDHQRGAMAVEVGEEAVDDLLPTEVQATEPIAVQFPPQRAFGRCRRTAELTGT